MLTVFRRNHARGGNETPYAEVAITQLRVQLSLFGSYAISQRKAPSASAFEAKTNKLAAKHPSTLIPFFGSNNKAPGE